MTTNPRPPVRLPRVARLAVALLAFAALAGCGGDSGGASVSGTVTFDGQPLAEGYVQFTPKDGKGSIAGASVLDGKYKAAKVPTGPVVVFVSSGGAAASAGPVGSGEAYKPGKKGVATAQGQVPADAVGNKVTVEIKPGSNEVNLDLKTPKGR